MAESGSSLSKIMTDLFLKEQSVLHVLKKTEHLRRLRKRLKKDIKKISPLLAPHMPKWSEDFEHSFISINLFITEINILLRIDNPVTQRAKKFWNDFWESSDDEEKEEFESACGDFSGEEEERNEETNWESILSLLKKLVKAVTELKGADLEDGELEEILRDLKNLPEFVDVVDNIPEDLLVGVGEASIHERETFVTGNDRKIVWPPMLILVNTGCGKDDTGKWHGMGDEALEIFSLSKAVGSRSAYGPQGHRGMNMLIFEASAVGFMEAELLDKRFERSGIGHEAWCRSDRVLILDNGKRKVYGYMAKKSDVDIFNQYFEAESKLKVEMRSYQEMVVNPMKQTNEDFETLNWYKKFMNRVAKRREQTEKFVNMLPWEVQKEFKRSSKEGSQSREIVWPPVVIIFNTELDKFDKGKRLGMGDAEVLRNFNAYQAVRSQQSYGPKGHRGMSALIFRASAVGFMDAEFLSEILEERIKDKEYGCSCPEHRVLRLSSGERILYGQMAEESDMRKFNKHAQGESELKFEMRSYQEMVVDPMEQMWLDYDIWKRYMSRVVKGNQHLEDSFDTAFEIKLCPSSPEIKLCPSSRTR